MPLPRFEKLAPEKRERILEAAGREFAARGYENASLNRILEEAGISKGAAYYYFEDKADLIATVIHHHWLEAATGLHESLVHFNAEDFWERLADLYLHPFELIHETPWMLGMAEAVWSLPPEIREQGPLKRVFDEASDWLRAFIHRGIELGVVREDLDEEIAVQLLMALDSIHDRWMARHLAEMTADEREGFTRTFVDFFRRLLTPGHGE
jgi:AcrR family transcriptional regulator